MYIAIRAIFYRDSNALTTGMIKRKFIESTKMTPNINAPKQSFCTELPMKLRI